MPTTTRRRKPTPAQQEAAKARRATIHRLAKVISELSEDARLDLASRSPLVTCEGHTLSPFNTCLVTSQQADATIIGGFQQWRKAGRQVQKGARGLAIFVPKFTESEQPGSVPDEKRFLLVTMFDITSTQPLQEDL